MCSLAKRGITTIEFGMIIGMIAVSVLSIVSLIGDHLGTLFASIIGHVAGG